jgi:stage III sporulation protein AH
MKIFKRNAIIITVILFVCVAVYLNWSYNKKGVINDETMAASELTESENTTDSESGLFFDESENNEAEEAIGTNISAGTDYFANARLTRQQARDSAISTLSEAAKLENASQEAIDQALASITVLANYEVSEAEIEALITAKGFDECVVFLNDNSAIVTVSAPSAGLSQSDVARITDIVLSETALTTEQIKIIEVK